MYLICTASSISLCRLTFFFLVSLFWFWRCPFPCRAQYSGKVVEPAGAETSMFGSDANALFDVIEKNKRKAEEAAAAADAAALAADGDSDDDEVGGVDGNGEAVGGGEA